MIIARLSDSYNRAVFAVLGNITNSYSGGCIALIQSKQATSISCAEDIFREIGWREEKTVFEIKVQPSVSVNFDLEE